MGLKLDPDTDLDLDVDDLQNEFRRIGPLIYSYSDSRAQAHEAAEIAEAEYDECCAQTLLDIRSREEKVTEATVKAMVTVDPKVKKALRNMLNAKKDYETISGYVDGLKANKDMLVQLGADSRKERD